MRERFRDFPLTIEEVKCMMKEEEAKKAKWAIIGVSVIAALIGLIVWLAKKREKDLDDEYEYIDDDFEELDDELEDFDESIYEDGEDDDKQVEYVKINDFMKEEDEAEAKEEETKEEADADQTEKEDK